MEGERRSRDDWIVAGLADLGVVGIDAVRVDRIARELGVTKGSFYWHFKNRGELLDAVADGWETRSTEDVIAQVDQSDLDPVGRARKLWHTTTNADGMQAELSIREWARRDKAVAARVERVDDRRIRYVESLLSDAGVPAGEVSPRALLAYSLLLGDFLIATTEERDQVVLDALMLLLRPE